MSIAGMRALAIAFGLLLLAGSLPAPAQLGGGGQGQQPPVFVRYDNFVTVVSPHGDQVASFNVMTGKTSLVRLAEPKDPPLTILPVSAPGVVALSVEGPKVTRIAASDTATGILVTQDLSEPARGRATPVLGPGVAAYVIGRHAYGFSPALNRWGVVELAAGHEDSPQVGSGHATVTAPGHVYTFSSKTGKWDDIDLFQVFGVGGAKAEAARAERSGPLPILDTLPERDEPPSEDEVWGKLLESGKDRHLPRRVPANKAKFVFEKVGYKVDPCKDYPLAGSCRLVHNHYKCVVQYEMPVGGRVEQRVEVVYVDKDVLVRCNDPSHKGLLAHPRSAGPGAPPR
jgi:hypothetical protein